MRLPNLSPFPLAVPSAFHLASAAMTAPATP